MTEHMHILNYTNAEGTCQLCGDENEELRPYGPNGELICFTCGMKDEATTRKMFLKSILPEGTDPDEIRGVMFVDKKTGEVIEGDLDDIPII